MAQQHSKAIAFDKVSFYSFLITIGLLPIFFIPGFVLQTEIAKTLLLGLGAIVALVAYLAARLLEGSFWYPKTYVLLGVLGVAVAGLLSALFSSAPSISFIGLAFDSGTFLHLLFLLIICVVGILTAGVPKRIVLVYHTLLIGAIVVGIFQILSILLQTFGLAAHFFGSPTANLLGSWNDVAVYFGFVAIIAMLGIEHFRVQGRMRTGAFVIIVISIFLLAVVNFKAVWVVLGITSLLVFIYAIIANRKSEKKFPALSFVVVLISLLFILANPLVSNAIHSIIPIGQSQIRPSLGATITVAGKGLLRDPIFGHGLGRFSGLWQEFHPNTVLTSRFWNVPFVQGVGFVPTLAATGGALMILALLFFIGSLVWLGVRKAVLFSRDARENVLLLVVVTTTLYLWLFALIYTPGTVILVFCFASTGMLIGLLAAYGLIPTEKITYLDDPRKSFFSILSIIVVMLASVAGGYAVIQRSVAVGYLNRGVVAFTKYGDIPKAERRILQSLALAKTQTGYRALAQVAGADLQKLFSAQNTLSESTIQAQFQNIFQVVQAAIQSQIALDKENPASWVALGDLYRSLVSVQMKGVYDGAKAAYEQAQKITPHDPSLFLALARLEIANKNNQAADDYITKALAEKPNYTDAVFVRAGLAASAGNLKGAIDQVQAAAVLDPNNPTVFFQLGLLYYNNKEYKSARDAFARAAALDKSSLNARYFYGIASAKSGDTKTATAVFEVLVKAVPDNQEIAHVLSNLQAGRDPLDGIVNETPSEQSLPIVEPKE